MKRLLLATAAALTLAVAAPLATAQYTTPPPATAPYTTPIPNDPSTPQDDSLSATQDTTANQPAPPGTPESAMAQDPAPPAMPYDTTAQAQTDTTMGPHDSQAPHDAQAQAYDSRQQQTQTYDAGPVSAATMASLEEHARDAGMDGLPMTPQEVCAPRELALTTSGTRLSNDKRRQLINATDRASVCEIQRVVVRSPSGRADTVRQTLVSHGVDADMIEVQNAGAGGLQVEMNFTGLATSSEQYAQMFSPQQLAGYQPGAAQGFAPSATPQSYQPNTSAPQTPGAESDGVWLGDPNAEIPSQPYYTPDGMSPTSGESAVSPELLDI
jgi:hypothetical protein